MGDEMTKIISLVKSINSHMCWSFLQLMGVLLKPTDEVVSAYVLHHCPVQGYGQTQRAWATEAKVPRSLLSTGQWIPSWQMGLHCQCRIHRKLSTYMCSWHLRYLLYLILLFLAIPRIFCYFIKYSQIILLFHKSQGPWSKRIRTVLQSFS